jgi:hypothetical protein
VCAKRKIIDGEFPRDSVALKSNDFVRFSHDVLNKKEESDLTHTNTDELDGETRKLRCNGI